MPHEHWSDSFGFSRMKLILVIAILCSICVNRALARDPKNSVLPYNWEEGKYHVTICETQLFYDPSIQPVWGDDAYLSGLANKFDAYTRSQSTGLDQFSETIAYPDRGQNRWMFRFSGKAHLVNTAQYQFSNIPGDIVNAAAFMMLLYRREQEEAGNRDYNGIAWVFCEHDGEKRRMFGFKLIAQGVVPGT